MGERRVTADGRILELMPDGSVVEVGRQDAQPQGVLLPEPPPAPAQAPGRTPAGATTEGLKPGFMWADPNNPAAGQVPIPTTGRPTPQRPEITSASYADAVQGFTASVALTKLISDLEEKNRAGPGSTGGVMGFQDFLPNSANQQFNKAAESMRGTVASVLGFTGGQLNSVAEANTNLGPFIPSASNFDGTITDTIARLKDLQKQGFQRSIAILGGAIDASGNVVPVPPGFEATAENVEKLLSGQYGQDGPNALTVLRQGGGAKTALPERGDVGSQMITNPDDIPQELNQEIDELRARMLSEGNGRLDPQAYAAESAKLGQKYGLIAEDPVAFAESLNQYLDAGGTTIPSGVVPAERLMSATETMTNNLFNNPVGGGVTGLANGLSAGTIEAIAPGQMMAMRDAQPIPLGAGEIGGGVISTIYGGRLAGKVAARYAPRLMQGSQFGRNVAADATYGALYGQNTQGDPVSGALIATAGSTAGQGAVRGGSAVVGGFGRTPEAIALREAGVPISVARQIGGTAARTEDAFQSIPVVGDMIRARQLDSFQGFNQEAIRRAGEPIGYNPTGVGRDAVDDFGRAAGNARSNVMNGTTIDVDAPFLDRASNAVDPQIPANMRDPVEQLLGTRLNRIIQDDALTAENYGITMSNLKGNRANPSSTFDDYQPEFKNSVTNAMGSVDDLIRRSGNEDVIANLGKANTSYRDYKILDDATDRAKAGTQTGEVDVFTPAQLKAAAVMARRRGFGKSDLRDFADQGQKVLPSTMPNTGSADRLIAAGLLGSFGAAGGALGYDPQNPVAGTATGTGGGLLGAAAAGGLLALGGRRGSQEALEKLLFERPEAVRELAEIAVRRGGGLFGSAGAIGSQRYGY